MICAELSHNHRGDLGLLKEMVATAAGAGVAAVKIQTHFADDLTPEWADKREHVKSYELDQRGHEAFFRWCMEYKVLPVTSVYSDRYSEMLKRVGFTTVKLGSAESRRSQLAKKLILRGFDLWISTGGLPYPEIPERTHTVFHCVSKYPHRPDQSGLLGLMRLKELYPNSQKGFSSHVDPSHPEWNTPLELSLMLGAHMVEVHFTLLDRSKTKDGPVSLYPHQIKQICDFDRLSIQSRYDAHRGLGLWLAPKTKEEVELIERYSGRWKIDGDP